MKQGVSTCFINDRGVEINKRRGLKVEGGRLILVKCEE